MIFLQFFVITLPTLNKTFTKKKVSTQLFICLDFFQENLKQKLPQKD